MHAPWLKRGVIGLIVALAVTIPACSVQYDGPVRPVDPDLDVTLGESDAWYGMPQIVARTDDPDGVFVIVPAMPQGNRFAAVRVSAGTAAQTKMTIALGPGSGTETPRPTESIRAIVRGLRFRRPAFHLFSFPGGMSGFHLEDSATGRIDIEFARDGGARRLVTERAYNSDRIEDLLARVFVAPGRWIAFPHRGADRWWQLAVWRVR